MAMAWPNAFVSSPSGRFIGRTNGFVFSLQHFIFPLFYYINVKRSLHRQLLTKLSFAEPCLFAPDQLMAMHLISFFHFCEISKDSLK